MMSTTALVGRLRGGFRASDVRADHQPVSKGNHFSHAWIRHNAQALPGHRPGHAEANYAASKALGLRRHFLRPSDLPVGFHRTSLSAAGLYAKVRQDEVYRPVGE